MDLLPIKKTASATAAHIFQGGEHKCGVSPHFSILAKISGCFFGAATATMSSPWIFGGFGVRGRTTDRPSAHAFRFFFVFLSIDFFPFLLENLFSRQNFLIFALILHFFVQFAYCQ